MAGQRSTKHEVQAYRFGARRVVSAVTTGSAVPPAAGGPRPGLAMLIGAVLAAVVLAGFGVLGLLRPAPSIGDAAVVVDRDGGGAYVLREGVAHPSMNLASAMLAAAPEGEAEASTPEVRSVTTATLATLPKGQLLGIPGAPNQVPGPDEIVGDTWQVCDLITSDPAAAPGTVGELRTTVLIGEPGAPATGLAAMVTVEGRQSWLVSEGRRFLVDLDDTAVVAGLGVDPADVRRVSLGLLNAIPEGDPLRRPEIPRLGSAVTLGAADFTVGEVLRVERATGGSTYDLVLDDGLQEVPPVVADIVRAVTGQDAAVRTVSPSVISQAPTTKQPVSLSGYPTSAPEVVDADTLPGLCLDWRRDGDGAQVRVDPVARLPLAGGRRPVPAPPGTGESGPGLGLADNVVIAPGGGIVTGQAGAGAGPEAGALTLVTDQGMAYPVKDRNALTALGLSEVVPAPPEVVSLLPLGPTLDPAAARRYFIEAPRG